MLITRKETFLIGRLEFSSLKEAREHIENHVGAILDEISPRLAPKQARGLLDLLIDNRKVLCELLNAKVDSGEWNGVAESIFKVED